VSHEVSESILTSVKKVLGLDDDYTAFDPDIIMFINSAFSTLNQLGLGPDTGFSITDKDTTWDAFIGTDDRLNSVKIYVYLKVRSMFDPPQTQYLVEAMKQQIQELEWRLNVVREGDTWVPPVAPVTESIWW